MDVEIKNFGFKPLIVRSVSGFLFLYHPLSTVSATEPNCLVFVCEFVSSIYYVFKCTHTDVFICLVLQNIKYRCMHKVLGSIPSTTKDRQS